jgi:hypothetical protein
VKLLRIKIIGNFIVIGDQKFFDKILKKLLARRAKVNFNVFFLRYFKPIKFSTILKGQNSMG